MTALETAHLTLAQLARALEAHGRPGLDRLLGAGPFFVVRVRAEEGDPIAFDTPSSGMPLPDTKAWKGHTHETAGDEGVPTWIGFEGGSPVVAIRKSDRNPFLGLITVGRAANNDLGLTSKCVSKLHAFLKDGPDGWKVQDSNSSNGTYVNHVRVTPQTDARLRFGDELRFADVTGMFIDRAGLETLLRIVPV